MKLNKDKINKILELNEKGIKSIDISKQLKIKFPTVYYHLNRKKRLEQIKKYYSKLSLEEKRRRARKYSEYIKEWQRKKYQTDKDFRERKNLKSKLRYKRVKDVKRKL